MVPRTFALSRLHNHYHASTYAHLLARTHTRTVAYKQQQMLESTVARMHGYTNHLHMLARTLKFKRACTNT
jgi:hypothetical protein